MAEEGVICLKLWQECELLWEHGSHAVPAAGSVDFWHFGLILLFLANVKSAARSVQESAPMSWIPELLEASKSFIGVTTPIQGFLSKRCLDSLYGDSIEGKHCSREKKVQNTACF